MNEEEKKGKFIQFPLSILATRAPLAEWLSDGFSLCVIEFINGKLNDDYDGDDVLDIARKALGFSGGTEPEFQNHHSAVKNRLNSWSALHGKTFPARMPTALFFETRDKLALTEIQIRLLLGINSLIGMKDYVKAGFPMLQARAAGWMRPLTESELTMTKNIGPIYSRGQIDRACRELVTRRFLKTFTYNRGERWWTNKMKTSEELAQAIMERKLRRYQTVSAQSELNAKYSALILAGRGADVGQAI